MKKLTKNEIRNAVANAYRYFAGRLYESIMYKHKVDKDIFEKESKKVFKDCDVSELRNFTKEEIDQTPGLGIWTRENGCIAVLLAPSFITLLPDDFEVECVLWGKSDEKVKIGDLKGEDLDTRFGMTAYGFFVDDNEKQDS